VLPVAPELVALAQEHRLVVTVEDGGRAGGAGSMLTRALQDADSDVPVRTMGLPQQFFEHGSRGQVLADVGLTEQDVARRIVEWAARVADRAAHSLESTQAEGVEGQQQ
jgi:1-deoxy-D-xylulose-5-phosphate synthase